MFSLADMFHRTLDSLIPAPCPLAVACSGGPDSLALTLLAMEWAKEKQMPLVAMTVDHGLRPESADEARQTADWLAAHGIVCEMLEWKGDTPKSNLQDAAREARYRLLTDACTARNIGTLLLGHHLEDQAETFLLRLARGSGIDGLAAMQPVSRRGGLTLVRPLLEFPKARLTDYLETRGQPFIRDPSNANPVFDRVKMRRLLPHLAEAGITSATLARAAGQMRRARTFLDQETTSFLNAACRIFPEGYARLETLPDGPELALRVLSRLIALISGQPDAPRLHALERLLDALPSPDFSGATLGGCVFARRRGNWLIYREPARVQQPLQLTGVSFVWDGRFRMTAAPRNGWTVGALGRQGWHGISAQIKPPCPLKAMLYSLPALRDETGRIRAVPSLNFHTEDAPEITLQHVSSYRTTP